MRSSVTSYKDFNGLDEQTNPESQMFHLYTSDSIHRLKLHTKSAPLTQFMLSSKEFNSPFAWSLKDPSFFPPSARYWLDDDDPSEYSDKSLANNHPVASSFLVKALDLTSWVLKAVLFRLITRYPIC
ncbi:hypothetical protein FCOIX_3615 [Fusarium coicis]|nr:hypothetical protein FCOIX_3615 [Fusarium coicis]